MTSEKTTVHTPDDRSIGERLVELCKDREAFTAELAKLKPMEVLEAQTFLWGFIERFMAERKMPFDRSIITKRMMPAATYQYRVGCNERLDYCRANICVYTNPVCASNKLRGIVEVLRQVLAELLV